MQKNHNNISKNVESFYDKIAASRKKWLEKSKSFHKEDSLMFREFTFKDSKVLRLELQSFVRKNLSAHEYPREVEIVKKLPTTSTGKILRRNLRDQN